jgi:ribose transport system substrate-binding protein
VQAVRREPDPPNFLLLGAPNDDFKRILYESIGPVDGASEAPRRREAAFRDGARQMRTPLNYVAKSGSARSRRGSRIGSRIRSDGMKKPLVLACALALVLGGCTKNSDSSSSSSSSSTTTTAASPGAVAPAGSKTIGFSVQNREAQFYQDMEAGMKTEAAKFGYTVTVVDAARDNAKQQSQVEDFISQKVSAIVLTPYDSQAIGSAIVEANKSNIPVFTADIASASKDGKVVSHIASDNVQGGMQAGKLMCAALPGHVGTIAIIDEPEVTSVQDRVKGFKEALKACPGVTIVSDIDGGGERAKASSSMEDILQSHKDLKGVFGINDDSALGAAKAIESAGLKGKIVVIGYDAAPEARTAIAAGSMYGDAIQHPDQIGAKTIDAIHDYFSGKTPAAKIAVPVGTYTKADAAK